MLGVLLALTLAACGSGGERSDAVSPDANAEAKTAADIDTTSPATSKPVGLADSNGTAQTLAVSKNGSAAQINSVDAIVGDMTLENDAELDGIPNLMWATGPRPAAVLMGADPRGCKMHSWWLDKSEVRTDYKDCDLWTTFIQWFVVYEGVGNAGHNVRVETREPETYYLSKSSGKWTLLGQHPGTSWFLAGKSNIIGIDGTVDERTSADGAVAIKVPVGSSHVHHGVWPLGRIDISDVVSDIEAIYSTVQARLVVDEPGEQDDRSRAILLMNSGADYYPNEGSTAGDTFPPGAGTSRAKRITNDWQAFNFATISAARQDHFGAAASIATEAFRSNPPPLD